LDVGQLGWLGRQGGNLADWCALAARSPSQAGSLTFFR